MNIKTFSLAVICGLTTTAYAQSLPIDHDASLRLGVNATYNATAYHAKDPVFIMPQAFMIIIVGISKVLKRVLPL